MTLTCSLRYELHSGQPGISVEGLKNKYELPSSGVEE